MASLMAALACAVTMVINIPSPFKGYLNLGDCIVLMIGWMISPAYGFLAAGLGCALADLFSGYVTYVPATFMIKGIMALIAFYGFHLFRNKLGDFPAKIISGTAAELMMILGYFVFEGVLYGFSSSLINIPANGMQGLVGLLTAVLLTKMLSKSGLR